MSTTINTSCRHLLIACTGLMLTVSSEAQPSISFEDNNPAENTYAPGDTFTLDVMLSFESGDLANNLATGISYDIQLEAVDANTANNILILTEVNRAGSPFQDRIGSSPVPTPEPLDPNTLEDLGAFTTGAGEGPGDIFISSLSFLVAGDAGDGLYSLGLDPLFASVLDGNSSPVSLVSGGYDFSVVVPEPTGLLAAGFSCLALARRRKRLA